MKRSQAPKRSDYCGASEIARTAEPPWRTQEERSALFVEFQPLVRKLILRYTQSNDEVRQDLAGEIYCQFSALLDHYDPLRGVPVRAYLVRNLEAGVYSFCRGEWRRRRRECELETEHALEATGSQDPSSDWDRTMMASDLLSRLPGMIGRLPNRQRMVVVARYYEGQSFEQIARLLNVQVATARSLLRHGISRLRKLFSNTPGPETPSE